MHGTLKDLAPCFKLKAKDKDSYEYHMNSKNTCHYHIRCLSILSSHCKEYRWPTRFLNTLYTLSIMSAGTLWSGSSWLILILCDYSSSLWLFISLTVTRVTLRIIFSDMPLFSTSKTTTSYTKAMTIVVPTTCIAPRILSKLK